MAFTPKQWKNNPDASTPVDAASLIDLEARLANYTDTMTAGGGGEGGNARVLLWDTNTSDYIPAPYRTDTSLPREFVGPTDPNTLNSITGPVFGDRWTPTEIV